MFTAPEIPANPPRRHRQGMTLLEVVVGLVILGLMAGAIYGIVSGSVESTATLAAAQTEQRRMETFLERTRLALAHFPELATLELKIVESEPLRQEFIVRGVPDAWIWGPNPRWDRAVITLCPRPWEETRAAKAAVSTKGAGGSAGIGALAPERYSLAMSVPDFYRTTDDGEPVPESPVKSQQGNQLVKPDDQGRFWADLLPEVARVEWRFWDPAKKIWLDHSPPARPPLIELLLFMPGRTTAERIVFSIH